MDDSIHAIQGENAVYDIRNVYDLSSVAELGQPLPELCAFGATGSPGSDHRNYYM
jgi:hypothetical protein